MVSKDHDLSVRRQCGLLSLVRSNLYYQPQGESAGNLRFMGIIDKQFLDTPWYGSRQMARYTKRHYHRPLCAQSRMPIDLIVSGWAMSLFQASHPASRIAS